MANYKLKDILNIYNLSKFFKKHKEFFRTFDFSLKHYRHIRNTLNRFLLCRDFKENYVMFSCPCCSHFTFRPITCKSRICPTCGKKYSEELTNRFLKKVINKPHRHILFTLPSYTWTLFIGKYHLLSILSDKLYEIFSQYFYDNGIHDFAFIVFFHTFGRDLKFNPHLHIIISEGGFDKNLKWKKLAYFPHKKFAGSWKFIVSQTLQNNLPKSQKLSKAMHKFWIDKSDIYFNVKGETIYNMQSAIKYLGRYLARAPLAEYKISNIENDEVTFWFNNLKTKKKEYITLSTLDVIGRLITHIQPKNFKMVRHYGIYSRNINKDLKVLLISLRIKATQKKRLSWQEKIYNWISFNPLICPNCNIPLIISEIKWNKKIYRYNL